MHASKSLYCCEWNFNLNDDSEDWSEKKKISCGESFNPLREFLSNYEQSVGKNMKSEGFFDEISDRNKKHYWAMEKR